MIRLPKYNEKRGNAISSNGDGTASIEIKKGLLCIIDESDIELVKRHTWYAWESGKVTYCATNVFFPEVGYRRLSIHRLIAGLEFGDGRQVDHVNRDGLDNRRSNLRITNGTVQKLNQSLRKDSTSGVTGVHQRPNGTWQVRISVNGKRYSLGHYNTKEEAEGLRITLCDVVAALLDQPVERVAQ